MTEWDEMADRTLKTAINVFKTPGVYTAKVGDPPAFQSVTVQGVFDRVQHSVDLNTGAQVDSFQPSFGIRFADLTDEWGEDFEIQQGDRLVIKDKSYRVIEDIEDGQGGVKLMLSLDGN